MDVVLNEPTAKIELGVGTGCGVEWFFTQATLKPLGSAGCDVSIRDVKPSVCRRQRVVLVMVLSVHV